MNNWRMITVSPEASVIEAMKLLDTTSLQFVMVVSSDWKLLGSVTDGDIRRGILKSISLQEPITKVMNPTPFTLPHGTSKSKALKFLMDKKIRYVPLVDKNMVIYDVVGLEEDRGLGGLEHTAVLMVGGLGSRLGYLTSNCPKPMLKVGNRPLLEIIVENLKEHGFTNFIFCVNYMADIIQQHFGDGKHFGINIQYVHEPKRMGTAGALALLPPEVKGPILIMNGDIITKVDFSQFLEFHKQSGLCATMGVRQYDFQIPFGVVKTSDGKIQEIEEKPIHNFQVNAGIYILEKDCLNNIPQDEYFDMPQFFDTLIKNGYPTQAFPIHEYWLDIGREDDLLRAQMEFSADN